MAKLNTKLVIFAYPNYVVVSKDGQKIPSITLDKHVYYDTTKEAIKKFFLELTGIDSNWPSLIFHQSLVLETFENTQRVIDIVYSVYLEGQTTLKNASWEYKKFEDLDENKPHYEIIREVGLKRYV